MDSSKATVSSQLLAVGRCKPQDALLRFKHAHTEANQAEEGINRYRTGWDANAKADSPDIVADTRGSATSTRRGGQSEDANCDFSEASLTVNIALSL